METINLKSIGVLNQNEQFDDWWESEKMEIPYFDNLKLKFTIVDVQKNQIDDNLDKAVQEFLSLDDSAKSEASKYVYKNYKDFVKAVGEDQFDFKVNDEEEVWKHVKPTEVMIARRDKDNSIYIQIIAECDWEIEHGLQIIYRNGNKLSRVSAQDGHLTHVDAYGLPENEDKIC